MSRRLDLLLSTGGTFFGGPDLLLDRVLDEAERRGLTQVPLTTVYLGGSMLDPRILARAEHEFGIVVLPRVRLVGGAGEHQRDARRTRVGAPGRRRPPGAGVEVRIGSHVDPAECCIGGAHLFLGYVDADDDAGAFDDGGGDDDWFRTGDLAELRDGRLRISGRIKDIVIRNGLNIPIAEVDGLGRGAARGRALCRVRGHRRRDGRTSRHGRPARAGGRPAVRVHGRWPGRRGARQVEDPGRARRLGRAVPGTASGKVQRTLLDERGAGRPRTQASRLR